MEYNKFYVDKDGLWRYITTSSNSNSKLFAFARSKSSLNKYGPKLHFSEKPEGMKYPGKYYIDQSSTKENGVMNSSGSWNGTSTFKYQPKSYIDAKKVLKRMRRQTDSKISRNKNDSNNNFISRLKDWSGTRSSYFTLLFLNKSKTIFFKG